MKLHCIRCNTILYPFRFYIMYFQVPFSATEMEWRKKRNSNWPILVFIRQNELGDSTATNIYGLYILLAEYGVAIAIRGNFLWMVKPVDSVMSKSSPLAWLGNVQSKLWTRFAKTSSIVVMEKEIPGQPLLPTPNRINWNSCPLKSIEEVKNLFGWNSSGSSHNVGSLPIVHALIMTCAVVCQLQYHAHVFWHLELIFREPAME